MPRKPKSDPYCSFMFRPVGTGVDVVDAGAMQQHYRIMTTYVFDDARVERPDEWILALFAGAAMSMDATGIQILGFVSENDEVVDKYECEEFVIDYENNRLLDPDGGVAVPEIEALSPYWVKQLFSEYVYNNWMESQ